MPDEPNITNPTQSTDVSDPTAATPTMTDPQKLVDEALGSPAPTASPDPLPTPPVLPTPEPTPQPQIIEDQPPLTVPPEPPVETIPQELLGGTEPTPPTPASEPAPTSTTEEVPLAFAGITPPTSTTTEPTTEPPAPPVLPPTPPPMTPPKPEKKKGKGGKVLAAIAGFFLLVSSLWGGYWYYKHYLEVHPVQVAAVQEMTKAQCSGCRNGGWLKWKNNRCTVTGICGNTDNPDKNTTNPNAEIPPTSCANGTCTCQVGYSYCGGQIGKCVSDQTLTSYNGGCNKYGEVVYGIPTVYGANAQLPIKGQCPGGFPKMCACGDISICFDKTGFCDQKDVSTKGDSQTGSNYNEVGLCATAGSYSDSSVNATFKLKETFFDDLFTCTDSQCTAKADDCFAARSTCTGTVEGNSCTTSSTKYVENSYKQSPIKGSIGFEGKCGTVEQIDITCNGKYITSRTRINPPCEKTTTSTPTPTPTPTLACSSITKDKPTPKVGDQVKFTCVGTSTPAGAVNLTYQFQIKKDNGDWTSLTASGNTATYTIASVGTYAARCKACGTINNASVCDPTWTGATQ